MQLGIFAKTFAEPMAEETVDALITYGLTHVQFNMSCVGLPTLPERIDEDLCRSIAQAYRERGLTMAAISGTFNLCDPDESRLAANLERLDVLAAACRWLDTRIITLCTGTRDPDNMWKWHPENIRHSAWDALVSSMKRAVQIADRHEVTLAFEPEINNVVSSSIRARRLLDEIGSPWLKVVIDPANLFSPGEVRPFSELLSEAFEWLGPDIVLAHAKPPHLGKLSPPDSRFRWLSSFFGPTFQLVGYGGAPDKGDAERLQLMFSSSPTEFTRCSFFTPYATALREFGYTGAWIIHGVQELDVPLVVFHLHQSLKLAGSTESGT